MNRCYLINEYNLTDGNLINMHDYYEKNDY